MEKTELASRLSRLLAYHSQKAGRVENVRGFQESHGGLTFGFDWVMPSCPRDSMVIRLAPRGVRRSGNTDVLRQSELLKTLRKHGFPVAPIRHAGRDDEWFDTDYVIFEHVEGKAFLAWDPDVSFSRDPADVAPKWRAAVELLAQVHQFNSGKYLADWEAPTPIEGEVERWDSILAQAAETEWMRLGSKVRALLLSTEPPNSPVGLLHGDCQPSNILFLADGRVSALLDWELSCIGAQYYDLGWLVMIGDRESWHPDWEPVNSLNPEEMIDYYASLTDRSCEGINWYRALANYKMAVITGLFVKLHRNGKRIDPDWEKFGLAAPNLFHRACEILS